MSLTEKTTHADEALDLLLEQFKNKTNVESLVEAFIAPVQELEGVVFDVLEGRWIDNAVGAQLDGIGEIVGLDRGALSADSDYRIRLKTRIRLNYASGIYEDIYDVLNLMLGDVDNPWRYEEHYPASFNVVMTETVSQSASVLAEIIGDARGAGINGQFIYLPTTSSGMFTLSSLSATLETSNDLGFASTAMTAGGQLAGVILT